MDLIGLMAAPFAASVVLVLIHAYLGGHVLRRGVIFVDLAMAQFAAMGVALGLLFGFELESTPSYYLGLISALTAAGLFAAARRRIRQVPQEAIIGIAYVASSAAAILIADRAPHGGEHIKQILVGSILWVSWQEVLKIALIYGVLGLLLTWAHPRLKQVSENAEEAAGRGLSIFVWDFFFYAVFAFVVTSSVRIAGVLLVFTILIVPSVFAALMGAGERSRLPLAWSFGIVMSLLGMLLSYYLDFPTGAAVVVVFALGLVPVTLLKKA